MAQPVPNMSLIWTGPSARFHGRIFIQNDVEHAASYANWADLQSSVPGYIHINLFCDCSKDTTSNDGGIALAHRAWLPGLPNTNSIITAAWSVNHMYDTALGEFLAVSEALAVATQQIRQFAGAPVLFGQQITLRIFNDNMFNLEYLQGRRAFDAGVMVLVKPVIDLIAMQSRVIHQQGVMINLELHWIPGHGHTVQPHVDADHYSRLARRRGRAYSTLSGNFWDRAEEPSVVSYLKPVLAAAAIQAARYNPSLIGRIPVSQMTGHPPPPGTSTGSIKPSEANASTGNKAQQKSKWALHWARLRQLKQERKRRAMSQTQATNDSKETAEKELEHTAICPAEQDDKPMATKTKVNDITNQPAPVPEPGPAAALVEESQEQKKTDSESTAPPSPAKPTPTPHPVETPDNSAGVSTEPERPTPSDSASEATSPAIAAAAKPAKNSSTTPDTEPDSDSDLDDSASCTISREPSPSPCQSPSPSPSCFSSSDATSVTSSESASTTATSVEDEGDADADADGSPDDGSRGGFVKIEAPQDAEAEAHGDSAEPGVGEADGDGLDGNCDEEHRVVRAHSV
jgi:hypothetical protein